MAAAVASTSLYVISKSYDYILDRAEHSTVIAQISSKVDLLLCNWLRQSANLRYQLITSVVLTILSVSSVYVIGSVVGTPFSQDVPTYFALGIITFCMSQGAYWNAVIPLTTHKYQLLDITEIPIFVANPSRTSFIVSSSRTFSTFVLVDAVVVTVCLIGVFILYPKFDSGRSIYLIALVVLGYILTSYTFFYPQWNLSRMIQKAKDSIQLQLQREIIKRYDYLSTSENLNIDSLNHLIKLHEDIGRTPNTAIRVAGIQSFVSSLALPTLVAIIGSLDWKYILDRLIVYFQ